MLALNARRRGSSVLLNFLVIQRSPDLVGVGSPWRPGAIE